MTVYDLADMLREYVITSGYKPGDKISTEMELAERYGVSRSKIREATSALCCQGILARRPRVGTVVNEINLQNVGRDLAFNFHLADYELADALEARMIMEIALLKLTVRRITRSQLKQMSELISNMEKSTNNLELLEELDCKFHLLLLKSCGNKTLQFFGQVINELFLRSVRSTYWDRKRDMKKTVAISIAEHREIYNAIRDDEPEKAEQLLRKHLSRLFD